jgi:phosphoribosylpyrophosphate synthetase
MAEWMGQSLLGESPGSWTGPAVDVVASPDAGGVRRALAVRAQLTRITGTRLGFALMDKHREAGLLSGDPHIVGEVSGLRVLVVDDLIVSGASLERAVRALRHAGALEVHALLGHGRLTRALRDRLGVAGLKTLILSDSMARPEDFATADQVSTAKADRDTDSPAGDASHSDSALRCDVRSMVPLLAKRLQEV